MEEARREIADLVEEYTFNDPAMPIYSSVNAERVLTGTEAKRLCVEQIVTTTRWVDVERLLLEENYSRFIECGPGKVLTGLWKSVSNNITCFKTGTMENIVKL